MSVESGSYFVEGEQPPLTAQEEEIVRRFHDLYYRRWQAGADTINLSWFGSPAPQMPARPLAQELLIRTRPDVVVECGTFRGGSAPGPVQEPKMLIGLEGAHGFCLSIFGAPMSFAVAVMDEDFDRKVVDRGSLFALALMALPPGRRSRTGTGWLRDTRTRDPEIADHESHSRARISRAWHLNSLGSCC